MYVCHLLSVVVFSLVSTDMFAHTTISTSLCLPQNLWLSTSVCSNVYIPKLVIIVSDCHIVYIDLLTFHLEQP